jgi:hypothetical protein
MLSNLHTLLRKPVLLKAYHIIQIREQHNRHMPIRIPAPAVKYHYIACLRQR